VIDNENLENFLEAKKEIKNFKERCLYLPKAKWIAGKISIYLKHLVVRGRTKNVEFYIKII